MDKHLNNLYVKGIERQLFSLLILTTLCCLFQYMGTIYINNVLKYTSVFLQFTLIWQSIVIIKRNRNYILWKKVWWILVICFFFPSIRIIVSVLENFDLRSFIDGIVVRGLFYFLSLPGLAFAVLAKKVNLNAVLLKYAYFALPLGIGLTYLSLFRSDIDQVIFTGALAITCCYIPSAFLVFSNKRNFVTFLGWISIIAVFFTAAKNYSRSYTLVAGYLSFFALLTYATRKNIVRLIAFLLLLVYFTSMNFFGLFTESVTTVDRTESMSEKFQFETLISSIGETLQDGDFSHIFYWEGNSRQEILLDAFRNFTQEEWLWGRGIFGLYTSFVERHTIEMGIVQELFRWGIIYTLLYTIMHMKAILYTFKLLIRTKHFATKVAVSILIIKFLDLFIYGVPEGSVYTLLMFWALFFPFCSKWEIKKKFIN